VDEIHRVIGVLDGFLEKSESGWLVGDKVTYADLAFVTWHVALAGIFSPPEFKDQWDITKHPHYQKWVETMLARPAVKKVLEEQQRLVAESS
jgi:glutathione S-transferase